MTYKCDRHPATVLWTFFVCASIAGVTQAGDITVLDPGDLTDVLTFAATNNQENFPGLGESNDNLRSQGVTFLTPDTGDDATSYNVTSLSFIQHNNRNTTQTSGQALKLWVWEWNPTMDQNANGSWTSGDGLADGDPLDGTSMGAALINGETYSLDGLSLVGGDTITFNTDLTLSENTAYAFLAQLVSGDDDVIRFRRAVNSNVTRTIEVDTDSNQFLGNDLAFYVTGTVAQANAVPEPCTLLIWSIFGVIGLAFGIRRQHLARKECRTR